MNVPAFGECECIYLPSALSFYKVDVMSLWAEGTNISRLYKPYLFPLHTITNEQKEELRKILNFDEAWFEEVLGEDRFFDWSVGGSVSSETFTMNVTDIIRTIDFFHRYNFDCRGLIPKGLAIDATGLITITHKTLLKNLLTFTYLCSIIKRTKVCLSIKVIT